MRKLLALLLAVCVVMGCAGAMADEAPSALYPIRENGLWGYMNRAGEVVIEPQWDWAGPFDGDYAVVTRYDQEHEEPCEGLINRDGEEIIPTVYFSIENNGQVYEVISTSLTRDGFVQYLSGWYDKASGFFCKPVYPYIDFDETDTDLLFVKLGQFITANGSKITKGAYCRRSDGVSIIPVSFDGELYTAGPYREGYAFWTMTQENGEYDAFLLNVSGERVVFPENLIPASGVVDGVLIITDPATGLKGLAKPDGTVVLPPAYEWIGEISEGRLFFWQDGKLGVLDTEGNVLAPRACDLDTSEFPGYGTIPVFHIYHNGYALGVICDEDGSRTRVYLNRSGEAVFSIAEEPDENTWVELPEEVNENGLVWIRKHEKQPDGGSRESACLVRLTENGSEYISDFVFEDGYSLSEDLCSARQGGLWGYIDEDAQWIIPPQYDKAASFSDGLALVEKDGKLMYIDHSGAVVWEER